MTYLYLELCGSFLNFFRQVSFYCCDGQSLLIEDIINKFIERDLSLPYPFKFAIKKNWFTNSISGCSIASLMITFILSAFSGSVDLTV